MPSVTLTYTSNDSQRILAAVAQLPGIPPTAQGVKLLLASYIAKIVAQAEHNKLVSDIVEPIGVAIT